MVRYPVPRLCANWTIESACSSIAFGHEDIEAIVVQIKGAGGMYEGQVTLLGPSSQLHHHVSTS